MNTTKNKFLMTIKESKKKSISQIAAIGRKHKVLKYPILLFLVLYIFVYNFVYYFCTYFKMKERMAKAVAMAMCVILCVTSIDITAFAFTGETGSDKDIVGITSLSDEIANQKVKPDATLEDVIFPESLDVHVTYQVEKEIEVEVEEEKATPTPTPSATYVPSVEPTSTVEPTPSAETSPTEVPQGEEVDTPEENGEENQNVPEQNPPVEEQPEENNQAGDLQSADTQNEDAESQPDGEQLAKAISGDYDSIETVYVSMGYYAAEPSTEEIVVETLQKDDSDDESGDGETESQTVTKKEIVIEEVEEDVSVSATWSLDEENSSKAEFKDLEIGEKYIFVPTITEDGYKLADDVELPTITVTIGEVWAFEKSVTVDDVVITVTADEGVFPEGATIEARKVTESEENEVTEAIDEVRSEEKNVAVSYTFDITIRDKEGNEIEPDTSKGSVKVTFKMAEIANENLETDVYHVEETDEGLSAEGLDVNTEEGEADEAAVETEGFSFYTVEFTYGELQYVLEGDDKVELTTILDAVGIKENGEISKVEGSDDELFKPVFDEEEKVWYIEALKAFSTEEWLKVTIGGVEYEIVVTDAVTGEWSKLKTALGATSPSAEENQFEVSSDGDVTTIKLLTDFTANIATTLTVNGNKKLDLNGHVINANKYGINVINVSSNATLNLCDSDVDAEHYYKYKSNGPWVWDDSASAGAIAVDEINDSIANDTPIILKGGAIIGGTGSTAESGTQGGGIYNSGTLIIDGGNIVGNSAGWHGGGIFSKGTFELNGGNIIGNYSAIHGAGAFVSGVVTMNEGQIIYNAAGDQAGGVYLASGSFELKNGIISHNSAKTFAGAVSVSGIMKMYGGEISYNKTSGADAKGYGGAIHSMGSVYMYDGCISNNSAKYGGGIYNGYTDNGYNYSGTFVMAGGSITENNCSTYGGSIYDKKGSITLGGSAKITNNTKGSGQDAVDQNVYLPSGMQIAIASGTDAPADGMSIGVTMEATTGTFTTNTASANDAQYFASDNDAYCIYYKSSDKMLYLAAPATAIINPNGGTYPEGSATVADWTYDSTNETYSKKGSKVILPDAPTPPAYKIFKGWKFNSELFDAGTEVVFEGTENRTYIAEYERIGSSIKTFATVEDLKNRDCFALWHGTSSVAQKVYFSGMPWYIAGADTDGSLVLMSAPGNFNNSIFGNDSTYSTSTVRNYLTGEALEKFTTAEQALMQNVTGTYIPTGGDKLYLGTGTYKSEGIAVGLGSNIYVSMYSNYGTSGSPYYSGNWFWLRAPYGDANALIGYPGGNQVDGGGIHYWVVNNALAVIPAMNLNLSSVLFASSAPVASASTAFDDGMNFRIAAGEKIGSSATYTRSKVSVTKGTDAGDLYLYVQGKDSSNDWVWSTEVTENSSFDVSGIHDGADLAECAIWLETLNGSDRLAYTKEAGSTSPYTVTLDANGGSGGDESVEVTLYSDMPSITVPTKADAVFMGYFDAAEGGVKYYNADGTSAKTWEKSSDATLYAHWHTHSWTYIVGTGNDNHHNLYAVCSEPECEYYGTADDVTNAIALIVSVPSRTLTYDGIDFEATVTDTNDKWTTLVGSIPDITYEYKEKPTDSYALASNKKDAGYYKASIAADEKTAYIEYLIAKASITPSVSIEGWTYGASANTPSVTGNTGTGIVTYKYKKTSEADTAYTTTVPTACGEYTIKAEITETKNYNAGSATNTFAISKASRSLIEVNMFDYEYGADTAPTPSINPAASGLIENPSVTYKYRQLGSADEYALWTGDTTALAANYTYEMIAVIEATDSYAEYTTESTNFTVYKGEWKVTAPTAKTGLIYNCAEQELVNAGIVENGGKLLYSTNGTDYSESIPKATNAGRYNVYYKVAADVNHNESQIESISQISIAKADWNVTAPTAIAPPFTGNTKALINAGEVKDVNGNVETGKMLYSLNENGDYSATIPTATEVGSYTVYYKVASDDNHNEYAVKSMTATIEKADRSRMPQVTMSGYTYGQTDSLPNPDLSETPSDEPTVIYYYNSTDSFEGASEWKNITATTLNAGTYYMFAKLSETVSYRECHTEGTSFTVAKASCTVTAPTGKTLKYNGQEQELVSAGSVTGGRMMYSLDDSTYSANLPKAMNRGDYTVYYYALGDANHENSAKQTVTATIGKGEHAVTVPKALNPVYNGNDQVLISAGSCSSGTILYSLDDVTYTESISDIVGKGIASYTVYYKVEGDGNYETYGPKTITAKIVKKSDPTPTPTPKPDPQPTPSPSEPDPQPNPQPTIPVTSTVQYTESGKPIKNYVANNPTGSNIPLPYITTDGSKAGWKTINDALDAHKAKYKKNAVGTLSITMNGSTTVDTELITDAHEKKIPLSFALDDEVAIGIPVVNSVLSNQAKEGKATYFKVSSMTTAEAVSVKNVHAGLLPSDIVSIGGNENTPVVLTLCSNDKLSTKKSQLMTITFNAKKAGFKKGDKVYLYCGTSQNGIAMYKTGKVDKNGFVTFSVPMVSNYWTIGSKNMKNKLLRNNVALPR